MRDILRERHDRRLKFERVMVRKDVLVARGRYKFNALPRAPEGDGKVHLFVGDGFPDPPDGPRVGGGSGTVAELLSHVGHRAGMKVIDEAAETSRRVSYSFHPSSDPTLNGAQRDSLLKHVSAQTSLTFAVEPREVEVWRITDEGPPAGL